MYVNIYYGGLIKLALKSWQIITYVYYYVAQAQIYLVTKNILQHTSTIPKMQSIILM